MTRIFIDYRNINNRVIDNMTQSLSKLTNILNNTGTIEIPSNFSEANSLKNLPNDIYEIKNNLNKKIELIRLNSESFKEVENTNFNDISTIKSIEILPRKK